jgi:hypothetical protein
MVIAYPKKVERQREKVSGSGVWWIRFTDGSGVRRREKAGRHGDAVDLLAKRRTEVL